MEDTQHLAFYPSRKFAEAWFYSLQLYDGCIDFRYYVDYLFALSYPCNTGAGNFVFKILDSKESKGYLSRADIGEYFDSVY